MILTCDSQNSPSRALLALRPFSALRRDCRKRSAGTSLIATMRFKDLTGKIFGKLSVIEFKGRLPDQASLFLVKCSCGKSKIMRGKVIQAAKSCGCMHGKHFRTHGQASINGRGQTPEYKSWTGMKGRCLNSKNKKYKNYGGRGIGICKRWLKFENFFEDMGKKPSAEYSIGRIDNDGDYKPSNCRWETPFQQSNNKTNSIIIKFKEESKSLSQWAILLGIRRATLFSRIEDGWSAEDAISKPVRKKKTKHENKF